MKFEILVLIIIDLCKYISDKCDPSQVVHTKSTHVNLLCQKRLKKCLGPNAELL